MHRVHRFTRRLMFAAVGIATLAFAASEVEAQQQRADSAKRGVNTKGGGGAVAGQRTPVEAIALAEDLAQFGRRTQNALPLITAAQILIENPERPLAEQAQRGQARGQPAGAGADTGQGAAREARRLNPTALLAEAERLASGNQHLVGTIQQLRQRAQAGTRGAVPGPQVGTGNVAPYSMLYYNITFRGGEPAAVHVVGDGDTDLDVYVFDENDNLIAYDDDLTDECLVLWQPVWTGRFRIEVRNLGPYYNAYVLRTN